MKLMKKMVSLLLCFVLLATNAPLAFAANGETNIRSEISATQVEVGDKITLELFINEMTAQGFKGGFYFDNTKLEVSKITWEDIYVYNEDEEDFIEADMYSKTLKSQANKDGSALGVYVFNSGVDSLCEAGLFVTVTFVAIANGEAKITLREETLGTDAFKSDSVATLTVTVGSVEPECEHKNTTAVPNNDGTHNVVCECGEVVSENVPCSGGTADCENAAKCAYCGNTYGEAKGHGKTNGFRYSHVAGTDTHNVICADCGKTVEENVACTDKPGDGNHNCDVCGKTGITQCAGGTATCLKPAVCSECGMEHGKVDSDNHVGKKTTSYTDNKNGKDHTVTVTCECGDEVSSNTEPHNYGDDFICDNCDHELAGWQQKGDNWYYVVDGEPVTGNVRVPYPTAKINGVTYGPNAEDKAYWEANKGTSKYTDAETAVFVFNDKGVFQSQFTGLIDGKRYAVNGVIAWHVGLVEINGEYWYFSGDVNGGGNIAAEGDVYLTRINGIAGFTAKEVYNFAGGKFSGLNGLVDRYGNGVLYYYENSKLMLGNGLTKYEDGYIYIRSNGQMVVDREYWVAKTNGICDPGMYTFDENGFLQSAKDPTVNGLVDGIYYKNGMPYYAGLIEIKGDIYYINSAGEAVKGTYYITKVDNYNGNEYKRGDKLTFGADGKLIIE